MDNNNFNQNDTRNPESNQNQNNPYGQNQYNPNYNMNYQQPPEFNNTPIIEQAETKASTAKKLSIWAFVLSLICCNIPAIIVAIISLVFSAQSKRLNGGNLLPRAKSARAFAIAAIIIAGIFIITANVLYSIYYNAILDWASSMAAQ